MYRMVFVDTGKGTAIKENYLFHHINYKIPKQMHVIDPLIVLENGKSVHTDYI